MLPSSISLGVYRNLFSAVDQNKSENLLTSLRNRQYPALPPKQLGTSTPSPSNKTPHYFLCMIGGGHFAATIVSLAPVLHIRAGGVEDRQPQVLAHKTFHRYTTRRKQGGSQSAMDNSNRPASTAGSSLRRYNEIALQSDVRAVLSEWKDWIDTSDLIFIRATGNTNRRVLFGPYDGQVLRPNDERIHGFPFSTKRATQSEILRAFSELTRIKVSYIDEAALAAAADKRKKEAAEVEAEMLRKSTQKKEKPTTKKLSAGEEEHMMHTTQIQALIRRSKIPALLSYISNNSIPTNFVFHPSPSTARGNQSQQLQSYSHVSTPLHLAASSGSTQIVDALLTKAKFDPTVRNLEGKTPFEVSSNRGTRDAFRIARHELGESAFDWTAARVPSPLARKDVESRQLAEKAATDEAERQRRAAEVEKLRKQEEARKANEREKHFGTGKTMSPLEKTWTEKREEEARGMTPEMRQRLERERRARAAEERIKRMQQTNK
ncbi:Ankyrin repeat-containing domain protein [Ascosphaera apis ARSEF 7405]|uniref:Ankyrin repeat-containing domain protein n=1 Tax=Ascosphaera apis ARSEF 7405 TaxID=392613 RepID=A0A162I080_9EURO|nr:Ankyrin repeat-containing domain protein [Ascosphaera apis ARSEF 7405]